MALAFPLIDEGSGTARAALAQGLGDLAAFLATNPGVPLPGGTALAISVRVPGTARGERIAALVTLGLSVKLQRYLDFFRPWEARSVTTST